MSSIAGRDLAVSAASVSNPGASSSRALHVELTSQQRRLRHLRSIAARNIVNRNGSPLLDTYFTLHLCLDDRISKDFYKSEIIRDSLNPTWRSLDFGMLPDLLDMSVSCFVVRIWGGRAEHFQLLIEWKVNLDGLRYTGQQIRSRNPNEIIFGLNDGYYAADFDQKDHSERKKNSCLHVDQSSVRNSYSVFSLLRLHTAQRAIKQTQVTVQKIGKEIEEKLRTTAACTERAAWPFLTPVRAQLRCGVAGSMALLNSCEGSAALWGCRQHGPLLTPVRAQLRCGVAGSMALLNSCEGSAALWGCRQHGPFLTPVRAQLRCGVAGSMAPS
ncbi:hypothetical protein ACEWY4_009076 [Coilia grayii]|uniref:C2 domain-containing protein n=1 Tax=Coilia grayii TaxID=363190 RepID=A0ABD1K5E0_9TELE